MLLRAVVVIVAVLLFHPAQAKRKVALLIGNATYSAPATVLKNPLNDVAALKATLEGAGFDVTVAENLTRAAMSQSLAAFEETAAGAEIGLVYYSGHGIEVNGDNFLLPVDARLASDRDVKYESIQLDDLLATLSRVTKLKLVLLDACRDNPFLTAMKRLATRGIPTRGLARVDSAESNLLIGYATAPGDVALDGEGDRSPYAEALARHLVAPGREVMAAMQAVARDVYSATDGKQRPFIAGSLFETVMLGPRESGASPSATQQAVDPCRDAAAHWAAVGGRKDKALLEEHLQHFRTCAFASVARLEIAALAPAGDIGKAVAGGGAPETACDRLAAQPGDPMKLASVAGVGFDAIALPDAVTACRSAVQDFPGDVRLRYQLGRALHKAGDGGAALAEYRIAAEAGHRGAANNIGNLYHDGEGTAVDYAEAMKWYLKAAEGGEDIAMYNVGGMYKDGQGVPRDDAEALKWYRKAAEAGNIDGIHNVGYFLDLGRGVTSDHREAMVWYRKGAALGNAVSMNNIGSLYRYGEGVAQDHAEAMAWYLKAADAGNAVAMNNIGNMYNHGEGVARNDAEALKWYRKGAEAGNADAMANFGYFHDLGRGVKTDYKEAMAWYRKAAALGNAIAMNNIGSLYRNGEGVRKDHAEAMAWYLKASDAGSGLAMQNIGNLHKNAEGVKRDYAEAMRWYRKAIDAGHAGGFYSIAALYDDGQGVSRDRREAARNMELALRKGYDLSLREMKTNVSAWSSEFRKALQQRLKDAGVYDGTIDGSFGPGTIRAIEAIYGKG